MTILGIETSCDETSVAIIEGTKKDIQLKANVLATSLTLHAKTGGIIPEQAAREQLKYMLPTLKEALNLYNVNSKIKKSSKNTYNEILESLNNIDAIAVTYGPGLIGSLLVGIETAKTLAYILKKPIIPVNHMIGHIYANWISANNYNPTTSISFPLIALVVSGGHTDLLLLKKHGHFQLLGGTRDDAAGEAFDKIGRMLGLAYPAGPEIEQLAKKGDSKRFNFPRPLLHDKTYEFSFSGLKTAVLREIIKLSNNTNQTNTPSTLSNKTITDVARGTQDAIIDILVKKTLRAAKEYNVDTILLSGGVSANQTLRETFTDQISKLNINLFVPDKSFCTDNAAMVATAAYFNYFPQQVNTITADPELYF